MDPQAPSVKNPLEHSAEIQGQLALTWCLRFGGAAEVFFGATWDVMDVEAGSLASLPSGND